MYVLCKSNFLLFLFMQLIADVKWAVYSGEHTIPREIQSSLEIFLSQQILHLALNFDEFAHLKSSMRVSRGHTFTGMALRI